MHMLPALSEAPASAAGPKRKLRQRLQTRARLVAAGRRVIAAQGVDGAAISAITDAADVGVGSFYNYFTSKRELLNVIVAETTALLGEVLHRRTYALADPAERVAVAVRHIVHLATADPTWAWFVLRATDAVPRLSASVTAPIEPHIHAGIAGGRFTVDDPVLAVNAIGGMMLQVMRARLLDRVGPGADRIAAEHVLRMLGLSPAKAHALVSAEAEVV
ncbi:MAG: TetR/AcrR family transcriptional regulator [Myxococcales bacterium]|nr:TetR/AcrR family transcriptional regulator [Myxococcales bacterium]